MPNLECYLCGSTDDVKWSRWYGEEVPLCHVCRNDWDEEGNYRDCEKCNDDFEYDDYVPL